MCQVVKGSMTNRGACTTSEDSGAVYDVRGSIILAHTPIRAGLYTGSSRIPESSSAVDIFSCVSLVLHACASEAPRPRVMDGSSVCCVF